MKNSIVSEVITSVYAGSTCWILYKDKLLDPIKSNHYAVVMCEYGDGTIDSFIAPVVPSRDGIMTWANYFDSFVGVIHQDTRPTESEILVFARDIEEIEKRVAEILRKAGSPQEPKPSEAGATIKFNPKRKPVGPDNNK